MDSIKNIDSDLIIPSEIPWGEIKDKALEEMLYWLFDSMGAKNLTWRIGGKGKGAADGGRDLELSFFQTLDGNVKEQKWWIEAKGRSVTVEKDAVTKAAYNALSEKDLDILLIATNTNFSNPTRDWVKQFNENNKFQVLLWEQVDLEKYCSKHPSVIVRTFPKALTLEGKLRVAKNTFWNLIKYSGNSLLELFWEEKEEIEFDSKNLIALVASEIANGNINKRSWGVVADSSVLTHAFVESYANLPYLIFRAEELGYSQKTILDTVGYFILISLDKNGLRLTSKILKNTFNKFQGVDSLSFRSMLLKPILFNLKYDLSLICMKDCSRVSSSRTMTYEHRTEDYLNRLQKVDNINRSEDDLIIEAYAESCNIGLDLSEKRSCPFLHENNEDISDEDIEDFLNLVRTVLLAKSVKE